MFPDPEEMKAKVRQAMLKPDPYTVFDFYHKTGIWQAIARSPLFENVTLAVISLNALWIAIDTDANDASALLDADPVFQIGEHFFCLYFSLEWFIRYMSFRRKRDGLKDGWFIFDSCLVLMMALETWALPAIMLSMGNSGSSGLGGTSILRLFRLLRLSRMARMLRSMPELMILIKGMVAAIRSVFFVMALLIIMMYMFAIALTLLADGVDVAGEEYFPNVPKSMFTLWVHGTLLDDLAGICNALLDESLVCLVVFNLFILISALTIMNMLIGVLCEVVAGVASTEKESMMISFVQEKLQQIMKEIDDDCDLQVSRTEFLQILDRRDACKVLQELDVDPEGMVDNVDFIFDNDCGDGEEKKTFGEFMEKVLQLRGGLNSTVKDIVELRRFVKYSIRDFQQEVLERLPPAPAQRPVAANGAAGSSTWEIPAQPSAPAGLPPSDQPTRKDMERLEEMMSSLICEVRSMRSEQQQYQRQLQALPGAMSPDLS